MAPSGPGPAVVSAVMRSGSVCTFCKKNIFYLFELFGHLYFFTLNFLLLENVGNVNK